MYLKIILQCLKKKHQSGSRNISLHNFWDFQDIYHYFSLSILLHPTKTFNLSAMSAIIKFKILHF